MRLRGGRAKGGLALAVVGAALALPSGAGAGFGSLSLVSADLPGTGPGNGDSFQAAGTPDGRFVAFASDASNLVPGDTNGATDVFVRNLAARTTTLVSRSTGGPVASGDDYSVDPQISDDGRYVAFRSRATNLVAGQADSAGTDDIFLRDNVTGSTSLVSHASAGQTTAANGMSDVPEISADGRFVTFRTNQKLLSGQTQGPSNYYIWDRNDGSLALINHVQGNLSEGAVTAAADEPHLSADGAYVAYLGAISGTPIVPGAGTGANVYLYNVATKANTFVSHKAGAPGTASSGGSSVAAISGDGRFVFYSSDSTDLVAGQNDPDLGTDANTDAFLYDRVSDTSTLVSHKPGDPLAATGRIVNFFGTIARSGSRAAWLSTADDVVAGQSDSNGGADAFLYDRASGVNTLVSHAAGSPTTTANRATDDPLYVSPSGRYVGYSSGAGNIVPGEVDANGNLLRDAYAFDTTTGTNTLVSHAAASASTTGNGLSEVTGFAAEGLLLSSSSTDILAADNSGSSDIYLASNVAPSVSFSASRTGGRAPLGVAFTASGLDPDGMIASYAWNFGDGGSAVGPAPLHSFGRGGTYPVSVTVTDDSGATAVARGMITVLPSLSELVNALINQGRPCHFKMRPSFAVIVCGGNRSGKPDLRAYVVNVGAAPLRIRLSAAEALPSNASALARVAYGARKLTVPAGATRSVKLKAPRKLRNRLAAYLRKHRRVVRRPRIIFTVAGKDTALTHRVVMVRPRRRGR